MNSTETKRIFGLDIIRSMAIIFVILGHSTYLIDPYFSNNNYISLIDGVDLFFVLSGFLIGKIIINLIEENKKIDLKLTAKFLIRRWFRTLPNYYLFLLINIVLIAFGVIKGFLNKFLITYFLFFQNFHKPYDFLFWESWSLSVEEWFYLLFPIILILLFKIIKTSPRYIILISIILFISTPLIYRIIQSNAHENWELYFRKIVLARLDTIGYGILAAYLHIYHALTWKKYKNILFILGMIFLAYISKTSFQNMYFLKTFYFSLMGISILLILPKLESIKNENIPLKPFAFISKISYSMYLSHLLVLQIISKTYVINNRTDSVVAYLSFWLITILISTLVYKYFERPIMNLRDKIKLL